MVMINKTELREREREFYLTPDQPGCGHKAADTAESSECSMSICSSRFFSQLRSAGRH